MRDSEEGNVTRNKMDRAVYRAVCSVPCKGDVQGQTQFSAVRRKVWKIVSDPARRPDKELNKLPSRTCRAATAIKKINKKSFIPHAITHSFVVCIVHSFVCHFLCVIHCLWYVTCVLHLFCTNLRS